MSMLGQLVAGIGHEINNPIGCIGGNILHVEGFAQDLLNLVHLYQQKYPQPDRDIDDLIEEIDLAYLSKDLPKLMKSMQEGVNRLQDISLSLRTFARSDIAHKVEFQVHEGIESTLMLLKHRTKANAQRPAIQIIEQFGKLPPISCYSGQLNQVFMNILANAIDALDDANHGRVYQDIVAHPNTIVISTSVHADRESVVIRIQDNGKGIPLELQGQIFEPTFTSKAVGKGTGLGLPISRQIVVEKHGGTLDCQSIIDAGTEFVIRLPI